MIDIVTKGGQRIGKISDSMEQDDIIFIDGKPIKLSDAYVDEKLKKDFNDSIRDTTNVQELED